MSVVGLDCETRVSVKGSSDYLPRMRRIVACLADSAGMDSREADEAEMILSRLCADAVRHGSMLDVEQPVSITLRVSEGSIVADLPALDDSTASSTLGAARSVCERLLKVVSEGVQFVKSKAGLTVRLTKLDRGPRRVAAKRPSPHHRN